MLLMFPIGAIMYYNERKDRDKYLAVFSDFMQKVDASRDFNNAQKIEKIRELFLANRYEVVYRDEKEIVGERKILSMGLLMMGLFFYVFYFFFMQKPHRIQYNIKSFD